MHTGKQQMTGINWVTGMRSSRLVLVILLGLLGRWHTCQAADFSCTAGDVACLIAAINTANANGQANTITLAAGTYTVPAVDNTTAGPNGLPSITSALAITGAGTTATSIERGTGAPPCRLMHVAVTGNLTLKGLTLHGGGGSGFDNPGGGIFNDGTLTITNSTLSGNLTYSAGGGIFNRGLLTITNSILTSNYGYPSGGGIANSGTLTITNSTLTSNYVYSDGGGIFNGGPLTITNSTLTRNSADVGGGIANNGPLTITNSTLTSNGALAGGGIANGGGPLTITNSTLTSNYGYSGGGILNWGIHSVELQNTILALNTPYGPYDDCEGPITSLDNNLIGHPTYCTITLRPYDLTGDPGFGDFTDTGTPGNGHVPLLPTSRVIDAGNDAACPPTDQLGQPRVGRCDIGAIEFQPAVLTVAIDIQPGSDPASINPKSHGVIPVAILTTKTFDATTVDATTVHFGKTGMAAAAVQSALDDVDGDGALDMILHFNTPDTGIQCGDTSASLTGETFSKQAIQGTDAIVTVGCKQ